MDWTTHLTGAQQSLAELDRHLGELNELRDASTSQVMSLGRVQGVALNADGVAASIETPYGFVQK